MQLPSDMGPFHIIGIGGIGMSAIAEILLAKGYQVQGSDQKESANVRRLRAKGIRVFVGHAAANLEAAGQVVISTAVKPSNPELEAARAKGLPPGKALRKYPLRMSLNFFISDIGDILPSIVSGAEIVAIVLSLQTTGPLLIRALQSQDMYLAGSFLMFLSFLTVIGVLISDIALAILDPRIRLQGTATK